MTGKSTNLSRNWVKDRTETLKKVKFEYGTTN